MGAAEVKCEGKAASKAKRLLAEALSRPGVGDLMRVYEDAQEVQRDVSRYLAVYADSERLVVTGVSTSTTG